MRHKSKEKNKRFKVIYQRMLAGFMTVGVVAAASFTMLKNINVEVIKIFNDKTSLSMILEVKSDDLDDLVIVNVASLYETHELTIGVGKHELIFSDLVVGRTYDIKIKADLGFGNQVIKHERYKLNEKPIGRILDVTQFESYINLFYNVSDPYNRLEEDVILRVYEGQKIFYETEIPSADLAEQHERYISFEVNPDNTIYRIELIGRVDNQSIVLDSITYRTEVKPQAYGEAYFDLDTMHYYLYIEDIYEQIKDNQVRVEIHKGDTLVYQETYNLIEQSQISNELNITELGIYQLKVVVNLLGKSVIIFEQSITKEPIDESPTGQIKEIIQNNAMLDVYYSLTDNYNKLENEIYIRVYEGETQLYEEMILLSDIEEEAENILSFEVYPENITYRIELTGFVGQTEVLLDSITYETRLWPIVMVDAYLNEGTISYYVYVEDTYNQISDGRITIQIRHIDTVILDQYYDIALQNEVIENLIVTETSHYKMIIYAKINEVNTIIYEEFIGGI